MSKETITLTTSCGTPVVEYLHAGNTAGHLQTHKLASSTMHHGAVFHFYKFYSDTTDELECSVHPGSAVLPLRMCRVTSQPSACDRLYSWSHGSAPVQWEVCPLAERRHIISIGSCCGSWKLQTKGSLHNALKAQNTALEYVSMMRRVVADALCPEQSKGHQPHDEVEYTRLQTPNCDENPEGSLKLAPRASGGACAETPQLLPITEAISSAQTSVDFLFQLPAHLDGGRW